MKWNLMERNETDHSIMPEYGRRKLILYADTLKEIAESFEEIKEKTLIPIVRNIIYSGTQNVMNNILKGTDKK